MSYSVLTCHEPATPDHALPLTSLCSSNTAVSAPSWALTWDFSLPQKIRYPKLATCASSSSFPNICSNVTFLMKSYLSCLMPNPHPGSSLLATYHHLPRGRVGEGTTLTASPIPPLINTVQVGTLQCFPCCIPSPNVLKLSSFLVITLG